MKTILLCSLVLLCGSGVAFGQETHAKRVELAKVAASLSVARSVCSLHPEESAWVFDGSVWGKLPCTVLKPILSRNPDSDLVKLYVELEEGITKIREDLKP